MSVLAWYLYPTVLPPQGEQKVKFLLLSSWLWCNIWNVSNLDAVNSLYLQNGIQKYKNRRMRRIKLRIVMRVGRTSSIRGRLCSEKWRKSGLLCNIIVCKVVSKLGTSCIHVSFWHYNFYKSVLYFFMRYERKSKYHEKPFPNVTLYLYVM